MWRVYGGVTMVVAGIAGLIVAASHHPDAQLPSDFGGKNVLGILVLTNHRSAWSQTAYDVVIAGGWALVVIGALTALMGLMRYARRGGRA
jgi:hypothetical protein